MGAEKTSGSLRSTKEAACRRTEEPSRSRNDFGSSTGRASSAKVTMSGPSGRSKGGKASSREATSNSQL